MEHQDYPGKRHVCRHQDKKLKQMSHTVQGVMLSLLLAVTGVSTSEAIAAETIAGNSISPTKKFNVPAGPLVNALTVFAAHASINLSAPPELVRGIATPGLSGSYTIPEAFLRLLNGTGLEAVQQTTGGYTLRREPPTARETIEGVSILPMVTAIGSIDADAQRINPPTTVGSKIPLAQREIPQSISVVTQEQIRSQNMHKLEDAIRFVPGMTVRDGDSERMMFYSRGFPVDAIQYDGVTINNGNSASSPALIMFDRVEVLRGPAGVLNGMGGSGGAINMVRKRAPKDLQISAEVAAGSYDNYRGEIDIGTALNEAGSVRARFAASRQNRKFVQKNTYRDEDQFYGTIEADLTANTIARIGIGYQELDQRAPWNGYPAYSDYTFLKVPRSLSLVQDWNKNVYKTTSTFAELEHKFDNAWVAKVSVTSLQHRNNLLTSSPISPADPNTGDYTAYPFRGIWDQNQRGLDAYVAGPFSLFGRKHQLTVGTNVQNFRETQSTSPFQSIVTNIGNANYAMPVFGDQQSPWVTNGRQKGLYASTRLSLTDPLTVVLGARVSWWKNDVQYGATSDVLRDAIDKKITPNVGMVYELNGNHSLYASYSGTFTPQFTRDINNHVLKPIEGDQKEIGIKGEYFDKKVNASIALFRITEKNRAQTDPRDPTFTYYPQGKARSQGVDTQISGELLPGLDMLAGYTLTTTKYLDASLNTNGDFETYTPKHTVKLWANYHLSGELSKWTVGGGAYISSKRYVIDRFAVPQQTMAAGGYATFDARIAYQAAKNLEVALSGTNLFDKYYYRNIGGATSGNFIGNPRELLLSLRYKM